MAYLSDTPLQLTFIMDDPPDPMFFPIGAVLQFADGHVEPVLDPECRHEVQCGLECHEQSGWGIFFGKIQSLLMPKPQKYVLTLHSLSMCDVELARGVVTAKGKQSWNNHYAFN